MPGRAHECARFENGAAAGATTQATWGARRPRPQVIVLERQVAGAPLKRVSLEDMVDDLSDPSRRLLLFGENHEDARAQDVERSVYEGVARSQRSRRRVALALEFVDADAREAADSFATGASDDVAALFRGATDAARYGPIACLARALGCARPAPKFLAFRGRAVMRSISATRSLSRAGPIVAANAPRRHARLVSRNGPAALDELPPDDVSRLPPLPYFRRADIPQTGRGDAAGATWRLRGERSSATPRLRHGDSVKTGARLRYPDKPLSPAYAERLRLVGLKSANIIAAQCLWDAAMAHSCLDFLRGAPQDAIMLVCGSFHVQHFLGIVDHVLRRVDIDDVDAAVARTGRGDAAARTIPRTGRGSSRGRVADHPTNGSRIVPRTGRGSSRGQVERYTESDGPFEALERDEFRVVVCVPLDEATFLDHRRANRWDDKILETFADFIVFTRGDATGEVAEGTCPA